MPVLVAAAIGPFECQETKQQLGKNAIAAGRESANKADSRHAVCEAALAVYAIIFRLMMHFIF